MSELTSKLMLCKSKSIPTSGLKKAQLVQLLQDSQSADSADSNATVKSVDDTDDTGAGTSNDNDDDDVTDNGDDDNDDDDIEVTLSSSGAKTSSETDKLKLQIELAKLEIQRLKLVAKSGDAVITKPDCDRVKVDKSIQGLLPRMSNNDDEALNFFHAFERVLVLYNVETSSWPFYLPVSLNAHATKV